MQTCIIDIVKRYLKEQRRKNIWNTSWSFNGRWACGNDNDSDTCEEADRGKDEEENKEDSGHCRKSGYSMGRRRRRKPHEVKSI